MSPAPVTTISNAAFQKIARLVSQHTGIQLTEAKKQLVVGRLSKRLRTLGLEDFDAYYDRCAGSAEELQVMINSVTTNETSFFREMNHFEFLRRHILPQVASSPFRVWSAAASMGAEGYSIAMILDEALTAKRIEWEVVGTDINTEVLEFAKAGLYPIRFSEHINERYLKRYCLKGVNSQEGQFMIDDYLKAKVKFRQANLMEALPKEFGRFDVIFLRNMLIYFDHERKRKIVANVLQALKPYGYLFVGHAESLNNINSEVKQIKPTIYRK